MVYETEDGSKQSLKSEREEIKGDELSKSYRARMQTSDSRECIWDKFANIEKEDYNSLEMK